MILGNRDQARTAQTIANRESPRTTKLYDRTRESLSADEIQRSGFRLKFRALAAKDQA
jgi:hypothetical protein